MTTSRGAALYRPNAQVLHSRGWQKEIWSPDSDGESMTGPEGQKQRG
jgi:hypothetical protein